MNSVKIHIVQLNTEWEKPAKNLVRLSGMLEKEHPSNGVIVLPEMFTTGFTERPKGFAEMMGGETVEWMIHTAHKYSSYVMGSIIIQESGKLLNRMIFASPEGELQHYDKHHLFRLGSESVGYSAGTQRSVFNASDVKIMPQICYDLRFPIWARNDTNYDVMINVANWPAVRNPAWEILLKARAIENQCFVVGANRVGTDGNGIAYIGNSLIIDPKGEIILQATDTEGIYTGVINLDEMYEFRKTFPVLNDRDDFTFKI